MKDKIMKKIIDLTEFEFERYFINSILKKGDNYSNFSFTISKEK